MTHGAFSLGIFFLLLLALDLGSIVGNGEVISGEKVMYETKRRSRLSLKEVRLDVVRLYQTWHGYFEYDSPSNCLRDKTDLKHVQWECLVKSREQFHGTYSNNGVCWWDSNGNCNKPIIKVAKRLCELNVQGIWLAMTFQ